MSALKLYTYAKCSTCRDAVRWLHGHGIEFVELPIRETPPPVFELEKMLAALGDDLRRLFNTSGRDYRAMGLKDKLDAMSAGEALTLLASSGNLVKRPFLIGGKTALVGFNETIWSNHFIR